MGVFKKIPIKINQDYFGGYFSKKLLCCVISAINSFYVRVILVFYTKSGVVSIISKYERSFE